MMLDIRIQSALDCIHAQTGHRGQSGHYNPYSRGVVALAQDDVRCSEPTSRTNPRCSQAIPAQGGETMSIIYKCDRCYKEVPAVYEISWGRLNAHPLSQYEPGGKGHLCYDCEKELLAFMELAKTTVNAKD